MSDVIDFPPLRGGGEDVGKALRLVRRRAGEFAQTIGQLPRAAAGQNESGGFHVIEDRHGRHGHRAPRRQPYPHRRAGGLAGLLIGENDDIG